MKISRSFKNISVFGKLFVFFLLLGVILLAQGLLNVQRADQLGDAFRKFYKDDFLPVLSLHNKVEKFNETRSLLFRHIYSYDEADFENYEKEIDTHYQALDRLIGEYRADIHMSAEEAALLDDFARQTELLHNKDQEVLALSRDNSKEAALTALVDGSVPIYHSMEAGMDGLVNFQIEQTRSNYESMQQAIRKKAAQSMWMLIAIAVLIGLGIFYLLRQLKHQLGSDPKEIIRIAEQVAQGKLDIELRRKASGIYAAIRDMVTNLQVMNREREQQNWIKTGQSLLGERTSGDQDIYKLAQNVINFLTPYMDAQVGAFYVLEKGATEADTRLRMFASHAYTWHESIPTRYKVGEGIVGQAALEHKPIVITDAPEDYIRIESGLGDALPNAILVAPFLFEDELKGVIELATLHQFTQVHLDFLEQIMPAVAIAVNTAESRTRLGELLEQSQTQARDLEAQATELEARRAEMQNANEELQSQSEELQVQQEELRQTNETLEERTRDLERQQLAVEEKNADLEKAKQEVELQAQELALASKYKSEFLANMSHELRTPLNSLLILAQLLASNKEGNLTERQVECAQTIHTSGSDLLTLINEVLDLSKVEAGKLELHLERVESAEVVDAIGKKFRHVAEDKGVTLNIEVGEDFPAQLHIDSQRLKQVVNNLLSNALKFTEHGSVTLALRRCPANAEISRGGLDAAHTLLFQVVDTGIGIPADKQRLIFEAFQQADGTTSRKFGGTGLGLSISRQLVQLMGGEIHIHSEPGKGSTFSVYLPEQPPVSKPAGAGPVLATAPRIDSAPQAPAPVAETPPPELPEEPAPSAAPPAPTADEAASAFDDDRDNLQAGDKILLVIEDDPDFSRILSDLAHEKGFKCLRAGDGRNGLELAQRYRPAAVMLDVALPQIDGWSVIEHLKDDPETRHIPVHMMSGNEYGADARRRGAIGYSLKPVSMADISEVFKHIEQLISTSLRKPLLLVDDVRRHRQIYDLLHTEDVEPVQAKTCEEAEKLLRNKSFDCLIVDLDIRDCSGIAFLEQWQRHDRAAQVPVVLYAERELSEEEVARLENCEKNITVKTVKTPERLLDEATLFLHQVESKLPQEKREMLRAVHDKDSIFTGRKILIVDDDVRNTFALATVLQGKQMEVLIGKNGRHGIQVLEQNPAIDLILMDIMMPEMDGYEAMRKIRSEFKYKKLPIIALTAKAMKNDKAKCIEAGASDYLAKPVDVDKLLSLMRVWLYR